MRPIPVDTIVRDVEARFTHKAGGTDTLKPRTARYKESVDENVGDWTATFHNPVSRVVNKIKSGDTVEFWLRRDAEGALSRVYGGVVGPIKRTFTDGKLSRVTVEGLQYAALLQFRHLTKTVAGQVDIGTLIHDAWAESDAVTHTGVTLGGVANPFGVTVKDMRFDYVDLLEFLTRVTELTACGFHVDSGKVLQLYLRGVKDSGIREDGSTGRAFEFTEDPETIENAVRGYGGRVYEVHKKQETQGAVSRVDTTAELKVQIRWPVDEVAKIEVYVKKVAGSTSDLDVRLESDNGSNAPSGIPFARATVPAADITTAGGYVTAQPTSHETGPGNLIWIIVKGTTVAGVDIGVDNGTDKNITYRASGATEFVLDKTDAASITAYGRREGRPLRDSSIQTVEEMLSRLDARLKSYKDPTHVGSFEAIATSYLTAGMGDYIVTNIPELDAGLNNKRFTITGRQHEFDGPRYTLILRVADGPRERLAGDVDAALLQRVARLEVKASARVSPLIQVLTASDSQRHADTATVTGFAKGSFKWGTGADRNKWGLADWGNAA